MTKKLAQFLLLSLIIIIGIFFYQKYFTKKNLDPELKKLENSSTDQDLSESKNNLIKNLKYDVIFDDNTQYIITAKFSEITYENDVEVVIMKDVVARFIDEDSTTITITADDALFNNSSYDSNFENNVKIVYLENIILSDKLDLNFTENIVKIYDNVVYENYQSLGKADNILIDLITKNIEIYMNNSNNKVNIISK